jgi:hypothetical protein
MKAPFCGLIVALFLLLFPLVGCGNPVEDIRNSKLVGREQTTVGAAFDAALENAKWEFIETANKTRIVQVSGRTKKVDANLKRGVDVLFQFMLKDDQFEITYAEQEIIWLTGKPQMVELNQKGVDLLLNEIYDN